MWMWTLISIYYSTFIHWKCIHVIWRQVIPPFISKTQWSDVKSVYLCVPATCLCYGPRWRRILLSLPAQEAWSDLRVERSSRSSYTLLVFICSVYTPYNEYGWSMVWFYVVFRSVSKLHTVRQQENSLTMFWSWRHNSLRKDPSSATGKMANRVTKRLDRPDTRTKPNSTVVW